MDINPMLNDSTRIFYLARDNNSASGLLPALNQQDN